MRQEARSHWFKSALKAIDLFISLAAQVIQASLSLKSLLFQFDQDLELWETGLCHVIFNIMIKMDKDKTK